MWGGKKARKKKKKTKQHGVMHQTLNKNSAQEIMHQCIKIMMHYDPLMIIPSSPVSDLVTWEFHPILIIFRSLAYFTFLCQQTKCLTSYNPSIVNCPTSCPAIFHGGYSCDPSKAVSGFPHAGCGLKGIYWQELPQHHGTRQHPLQARR